MRGFDFDLLTTLRANWPVILESETNFAACFDDRVTSATLTQWRTALLGGDLDNPVTDWMLFTTAYQIDVRNRAQCVFVHADAPLESDFMGQMGLNAALAQQLLREVTTIYICAPNANLLRPIDCVLHAIGIRVLPSFRSIGYETTAYEGSAPVTQDVISLPDNIYATQQTWSAKSVVSAARTVDDVLKPIVVSVAGVTRY